MADERQVLEASVSRLRALVEPFGPDQVRAQSYDTEWSVADVLSHLGSGAVIAANRIDEELGGAAVAPQSVWDEWNAKTPDAKAADALESDRAFIERLGTLSDADRAGFTTAIGPMQLDFSGFLRMRLNEHALHTWDVAVTFDPSATVSPDAAEAVLAVVPMLAGFLGKPTGATREIRVRTTGPEAQFAIALTPEKVSVTPTDVAGTADLELPTEAFVRLVYGRLDPEHTPAFTGAEADIAELRKAFPGF
jgi:uncharacterized protein (TIGR03083 family)